MDLTWVLLLDPGRDIEIRVGGTGSEIHVPYLF